MSGGGRGKGGGGLTTFLSYSVIVCRTWIFMEYFINNQPEAVDDDVACHNTWELVELQLHVLRYPCVQLLCVM